MQDILLVLNIQDVSFLNLNMIDETSYTGVNFVILPMNTDSFHCKLTNI